ncbi:MAG: zf-HC2 domain-containing protein [Bryobacteraceae bacterium]|nr:zf-HC2 domain-containing protein [Bryobacteraceae bacterium]
MKPQHIPDSDLLLEADGELSAWRAARIRRHLQGCWKCRARKLELEASIADVVHLHNDLAEALPPAEGSRARLRSQLPAGASLALGKLTQAATAVVCLMGAAWAGFYLWPGRPPLLPDSRLTPGVALPVTAEALCASEEAEAPPVDAAVARQVFGRYGIRQPAPRTYEMDYLITPALGGARDSLNLWPQPYASGGWNSRVKDALEDKLRTLVCSGQLDLATAQRELAEDWIGAYRRYFRTEQPLMDHFAFVKDRPWE